MPLWRLEPITPLRMLATGTISNAWVETIVVRAPNEERARQIASQYRMPAHDTRVLPGQAAQTIYSPFLHARDSTCVEIEADGPEEVIAAEGRSQ